jgi:hypothetical protein
VTPEGSGNSVFLAANSKDEDGAVDSTAFFEELVTRNFPPARVGAVVPPNCLIQRPTG